MTQLSIPDVRCMSLPEFACETLVTQLSIPAVCHVSLICDRRSSLVNFMCT